MAAPSIAHPPPPPPYVGLHGDVMDPLAPLPPLAPSRLRATSPEVHRASQAQAVLGEVSVLEAALRDASARKRANATMEECSTRFDSAVTVYSVQLKAWIDLQVDQRLGQVLDGELAAVRREAANAVGAGTRAEVEVRSITEAQTKLLDVVSGISEEIGRLKAAITACQLSTQLHTAAGMGSQNEDTVMAVEKATTALEELRLSVNTIQVQDNATAAELGRHDVAIQELRRLTEHHFQRYNSELTDATGAMKGTKREVNELITLVQRMENRFTSWRAEVAEELRSHEERRRTELTAHGGLENRLAEEFSTLQRRLAAELRGEMTAALQKEAFTQSDLQMALDETKREMRRLVSEAQGRNEDELREMSRGQHRQISDLRVEISAAFKSEASAVAALDEQLWLTDQRLGQRIDELVHQVAGGDRAGRKVVMERMSEYNSIDAKLARSQVTASRPSPASASGALAMAKVAGSALMEAGRSERSAGLSKVASESAFEDMMDARKQAWSARSTGAKSLAPRHSLTMARVAGETLMEAGEGAAAAPSFGVRLLDRE
mmetsp:Transcript_68668/g.128110  ORF Transcript_68668/g.128110 Transcript_68668/m.128110 type:complete len:550 (-) Transcript_68668:97-1746(-)